MKAIIFMLLTAFSLLTACTGNAVKMVEVTRLVPQTVQVTRIIPHTVQPTAIVTLKIGTPVVIRTELNQNTAYYEGIIVLAQYYTLLDQRLFEQAYQLLSSSNQDATTLEEFLTGHEAVSVCTYKLISVQPYGDWAKNQGLKPLLDTEIMKRFYIRVYAEGEEGMAGSVANGIHTFFATLVWENGEWKIFSINTSPN